MTYLNDIGYSDFRTQVMSVEELLSHGAKVNLVGRKEMRRSVAQRSRLVEAILMGIPQNPIFVDDTDFQWIVLEGMERLDALFSFCQEGMELTSLYYKIDLYEGRTFASLSPLEKNKILNTKIVVNVLNSGLSPFERFGVYMYLRPRMDAQALQWCRRRIFAEDYRVVEGFAKSLAAPQTLNSSRSAVIERRICNLLVGIHYRQFLQWDRKNHIDMAGNFLMMGIASDNSLERWSPLMRKVLLSPEGWDEVKRKDEKFEYLYYAVNYHLLASDAKKIDLSEFGSLLDQVMPHRDSRLMDCAETFCQAIDQLLNLIQRK